jgi:hypothetical protein
VDSIKVAANTISDTDPLTGVPEDALIDDKEHLHAFSLISAKTDIKVSHSFLHSSCNVYKYLKF